MRPAAEREACKIKLANVDYSCTEEEIAAAAAKLLQSYESSLEAGAHTACSLVAVNEPRQSLFAKKSTSTFDVVALLASNSASTPAVYAFFARKIA